MNVYVKTVSESQLNAMDALDAELQKKLICNDLATETKGLIQ